MIVFVDDLGYADLGCQGSKEALTPHIDSIAAEGVRLTSGYVTAPQCSPSRAGLATGVYPQRFGHEANPEREHRPGFGLEEGRLTIADRLKAAGSRTIGVGKWDLGGKPPFQPWARGFDEYVGFYTGSRPFFPTTDVDPNSYHRLRNSPDRLLEETGYMTDLLTDAAVDAIRRHQDEPFFLFLSYNAPHWPMEAKPEHLERFADVSDHQRRIFLAMLAALDDGVGRVLETLRETGLEEDTLVFFLSDNGGPTGDPRPSPDAPFQYGQNTSLNTPLRGVKGDLYEGGIRVPFLARWKGKFPAGVEYDHPVSSLDLLPTALAAVGAEPPADAALDGTNLLPHLSGERNDPPHDVLYWRWMGQLALRQGDWKLFKRPNQPFELYNLATDIAETRNVAAEHPTLVHDLKTRLWAWNAELIPPLWRTAKQNAWLTRAYNPETAEAPAPIP